MSLKVKPDGAVELPIDEIILVLNSNKYLLKLKVFEIRDFEFGILRSMRGHSNSAAGLPIHDFVYVFDRIWSETCNHKV